MSLSGIRGGCCVVGFAPPVPAPNLALTPSVCRLTARTRGSAGDPGISRIGNERYYVLDATDREIRSLVSQAKAITDKPTKEGRGMTPAEQADFSAKMAEIDRLKARKAGRQVRSSLDAGTDAYRGMARSLLEDGKAEGSLSDLLGKAGATVTVPNARTTTVEPGYVNLLPYDPRNNLASVLPRENAGTALAVQTFKMSARSITGSVERVIDATSSKADMSLTVSPVTVPLKMFSVIVSGLKTAVMQSEDSLYALLEAEMRAAIEQAIDAHCVNALYNAALDHGGTGSSIEAKVRTGIADAMDNGVRPNVVLLSPSDASDVALRLNTAIVEQFPFGLTVVESKAAVTSAPVLLDTSRIGALYVGQYQALVDPYSGASTNEIRIRLETNGAFVVRNHRGGLIASAGSGFTT